MRYDFDEIIERHQTDCVKYDLLGKVFGKEDIQPFWVADMDFRTPDFVVESIRKRTLHEIFGYPIKSAGFYSSIVRWLNIRHGWSVQEAWISFSPGVVPAINLSILAFTKPGDRIIIQPPVYFPFFSAVKNNGRELVLNELIFKNGHYFMDLSDLEKKAREGASMLILSHPHNPVGRVWSREELQSVASICRKYGLLILSDEIHSDLMLGGRKHIPLASLDEETARITITCMAPSKTFNLAGLATSFMVITDSHLREEYEKMLDKIHVGMGNIFGLVALQAAYQEGEDWLRQLLNYLDGNMQVLLDFFKHRLPLVKPVVPEATYLVWLDFRETGIEHKNLARFLVHEAGLALNEGSTFGPGGEGFMRMNIACPQKVLLKGLTNLQEAMERNHRV